MNTTDFIKKREKLVTDVPDLFIGSIKKAQDDLNDTVLTYLKDLKTTGGKIDNVPANVQMAARTRENIRKWLRNAGYYDAVSDYGLKFNDLIVTSRDFYRSMDLKGSFTERDFDTLSQFRKDKLNFFMDADAAVIDGVYSEVIQSVWSNKNWRDLEKRLIGLVSGDATGNGILQKYTSTRAFDAYAGFDRTIQNLKSAELGMELFLYSGGLIRDSRDFCISKAGKVFTKKQVDSWEGQHWIGKNTKRSVWEALGGFNCSHILSPVTEEYAIELGYKKA